MATDKGHIGGRSPRPDAWRRAELGVGGVSGVWEAVHGTPRTVRKYTVQEPPFLSGFLSSQQFVRTRGELEEPNPPSPTPDDGKPPNLGLFDVVTD